MTGDDTENADLRPFPMLVEALQRVNSDAGFNIEIKYPMACSDGTHELPNMSYFERNEFVDIILKVRATIGCTIVVIVAL